ncbi:MAG: hypothetical protein ABIH11_02675 [Candidatus Altiarchaeota archaeon]
MVQARMVESKHNTKSKKKLKSIILVTLTLTLILSITGGIRRSIAPTGGFFHTLADETASCMKASTVQPNSWPWGLRWLGWGVEGVVKVTMAGPCVIWGTAVAGLEAIVKFILSITLAIFIGLMKLAMLYFTSTYLSHIGASLLINVSGPTGLASNAAYDNILSTMLLILWPFYMIQIVYVGGYLIFAAIDPGQRAGAKKRLQNLILSLVLAGLSKPIYLMLVDISNGLITEFEAMSGSIIPSSCGTSYNMLAGMTTIILAKSISWWVIVLVTVFVLGVSLLVAMRYALVILFYLLFPATIFLYFFDFTRQLGGDLFARTIMWLFTGPVMALMVLMTMSLIYANMMNISCSGGSVTSVGSMKASLSSDIFSAPDGEGIDLPSGGKPGDMKVIGDDGKVEFKGSFPKFEDDLSTDTLAVQEFLRNFTGLIMILACFSGILLVPMFMTALMKWVGGAIAASGMYGLAQGGPTVERWKNFGRVAVGGAMMGQGTRGIVSAATQASWMMSDGPARGGGLFPSLSGSHSGGGKAAGGGGGISSSTRSGVFASMVNRFFGPGYSDSSSGGAAGGAGGAGGAAGGAGGAAGGAGGTAGGGRSSGGFLGLGNLAGVFSSDFKNAEEAAHEWSGMSKGAPISSPGIMSAGGAGSGIYHVDDSRVQSKLGGGPPSTGTQQPGMYPYTPDGSSKMGEGGSGYQDQFVEMDTEQTLRNRKSAENFFGTFVPQPDMGGRVTHGVEGSMTMGRGLVNLFMGGVVRPLSGREGASLRAAAMSDFGHGLAKVFYSIRPLSFLMPVRAAGRMLFGITPEILPPMFQPYGYWLGRHMASLSLRQLGRRSMWKAGLLAERSRFEGLSDQIREAESKGDFTRAEQLREQRDAVGDRIANTLERIGYGSESGMFVGENVRDWNFYRRQMDILRQYNPELYSHIMRNSRYSMNEFGDKDNLFSKKDKTAKYSDIEKGIRGNEDLTRLAAIDSELDNPNLDAADKQRLEAEKKALEKKYHEDDKVGRLVAQTAERIALRDGREVKDVLKELRAGLTTKDVAAHSRAMSAVGMTLMMQDMGLKETVDQAHFERSFGSDILSANTITNTSFSAYGDRGPTSISAANYGEYFDANGAARQTVYSFDPNTGAKVKILGGTLNADGTLTLTLDGFKARRYHELKEAYLGAAGSNEYLFHKELYEVLLNAGYSRAEALARCKSVNIHMQRDGEGRRYVDSTRLGYVVAIREWEGGLAEDRGGDRNLDSMGAGLKGESTSEFMDRVKRGEVTDEEVRLIGELHAGRSVADIEADIDRIAEAQVDAEQARRLADTTGKSIDEAKEELKKRNAAALKQTLQVVQGMEVAAAKRAANDVITEQEKQGLLTREQAEAARSDVDQKRGQYVDQLAQLQSRMRENAAEYVASLGAYNGMDFRFRSLHVPGSVEESDLEERSFSQEISRAGGRVTGFAIHQMTEDETPREGQAVSHRGQNVQLLGNAAHIIEGQRMIIVETEFNRTASQHTIYDSRGNAIALTAANMDDIIRRARGGAEFSVMDHEGRRTRIKDIAADSSGNVTLSYDKYYHLGQWRLRGAGHGHTVEVVASPDLLGREDVKSSGYDASRRHSKLAVGHYTIERLSHNEELVADANRRYDEDAGLRSVLEKQAEERYTALYGDGWGALAPERKEAFVRREFILHEMSIVRTQMHVNPGQVHEMITRHGYTSEQINDMLWHAWKANEGFNNSHWRRAIRAHLKERGQLSPDEDTAGQQVEDQLKAYRSGGDMDRSLRERLDREGVRINSVTLEHNPGDDSPARVIVDGLGANIKVNMGYADRIAEEHVITDLSHHIMRDQAMEEIYGATGLDRSVEADVEQAEQLWSEYVSGRMQRSDIAEEQRLAERLAQVSVPAREEAERVYDNYQTGMMNYDDPRQLEQAHVIRQLEDHHSASSMQEFSEGLRHDYLSHEFRHSYVRRKMSDVRQNLLHNESKPDIDGPTISEHYDSLTSSMGGDLVDRYVEEFAADLRSPEEHPVHGPGKTAYGEDVEKQLDARQRVRQDVLDSNTTSGVQGRADILNKARFAVEEEMAVDMSRLGRTGYEEYPERQVGNASYQPGADHTSFDSLVESSLGPDSPEYVQYHSFKRILHSIGSQVTEGHLL